MTHLLLESLEITNFRAFRHLQIERLGRYNLLVGPNNTGKTCLLEALWLYARRDEATVRSILEEHDEPIALHSLFSRAADPGGPAQIGPLTAPEVALHIETTRIHAPPGESVRCIFVDTRGLNETQIASLWDTVALSDEEVVDALNIVTPDVERLSIIGSRKRAAYVRLEGSADPVPVRSLGDGTGRMLGLALALMNARDGLLLVDEIETGLHHSVQIDMWRLLFILARRYNVQIFATTHSWDCVAAFAQVAAENEKEATRLIRLEQAAEQNNGLSATVIDGEELARKVRERVEVR